jgi:hypothetical protein
VDLKREVDLVEEVARLFGVDRIPSTAPRGAVGSHPFDAIYDRFAEVRRILTGLGLINPAVLPRARPWRRPVSAKGGRFAEGVRPLHWAARPRSYLQRTAGWAAPPGARWAPEADGAAGGSRAIAPLAEYNTLARPRSAKGVTARREALASRPLARPADVMHPSCAGVASSVRRNAAAVPAAARPAARGRHRAAPGGAGAGAAGRQRRRGGGAVP